MSSITSEQLNKFFGGRKLKQQITSPYNLFVDDIRMPNEIDWIIIPKVKWAVVKNYDQFVKSIKVCCKLPSIISFDYDLNVSYYNDDTKQNVNNYNKHYEYKNGYDCAMWLIEVCDINNLPFPEYHIHSKNLTGNKKIMDIIENYKKYYIDRNESVQ